jgi:hypothetical protein
MREELTVYVNGKPYVLREDERPFKNMQVRAAPAPQPGPAAHLQRGAQDGARRRAPADAGLSLVSQ